MAHKFAEIAFTPTVRALQTANGSREAYAAMDNGADTHRALGVKEADFIATRDSAYMATVSETGWPYLQHRGGPAGFIKVLDAKTLGFADYSGNRQYISAANLQTNDRVALFFMDYPNRRRLKLLGRARVVSAERRGLLKQVEDTDYAAQAERVMLIHVEAFDWNCPQHITPRFKASEIGPKNSPTPPQGAHEHEPLKKPLGDGPLALEVTGIRRVADDVRVYELRSPHGDKLPHFTAGAHLHVPIRLPSGEITGRHYSICSPADCRDAYEIAVLQERSGRGGSIAVHATFDIGTHLNTDMPQNHFPLHDDERPALLIGGGIGITPLRSMVATLRARGVDFDLHYSGSRPRAMAFVEELQDALGSCLHTYAGSKGERLDIADTLARMSADTVVYVCGPQRMITDVMRAARNLRLPANRIRTERFE